MQGALQGKKRLCTTALLYKLQPSQQMLKFLVTRQIPVQRCVLCQRVIRANCHCKKKKKKTASEPLRRLVTVKHRRQELLWTILFWISFFFSVAVFVWLVLQSQLPRLFVLSLDIVPQLDSSCFYSLFQFFSSIDFTAVGLYFFQVLSSLFLVFKDNRSCRISFSQTFHVAPCLATASGVRSYSLRTALKDLQKFRPVRHLCYFCFLFVLSPSRPTPETNSALPAMCNHRSAPTNPLYPLPGELCGFSTGCKGNNNNKKRLACHGVQHFNLSGNQARQRQRQRSPPCSGLMNTRRKLCTPAIIKSNLDSLFLFRDCDAYNGHTRGPFSFPFFFFSSFFVKSNPGVTA